MATITGGGLSLLSPPQLPGGGLVDPVLQAQDGSFVGTTCLGCPVGYGNIISFDAGGNVRWIVPNDTPQIATADGGVIGQSGITYDQYGNATGQIGYATGQTTVAGSAVPSWTGQIYAAGGSGVSLDYGWIKFGAGYWSLAGGNPSGIGTSAENLGIFEGLPLWLLGAVVSAGPNCSLGNAKPELSGGARQTYDTLRQGLLTHLASLPKSSPCFQMLNAAGGPFTPLAVRAAVSLQLPFDGLKSTLSIYAAGLWNEKNKTYVNWSHYPKIPVCGDFWDAHGKWNKSTAESQLQPPGTDVYIDTLAEALPNLTQGTILHESLHNLSGLDDQDLYQVLTKLNLGLRPTKAITQALEAAGCTGN
jgi:hypothetical protein